jgi:hypothetical protein
MVIIGLNPLQEGTRAAQVTLGSALPIVLTKAVNRHTIGVEKSQGMVVDTIYSVGGNIDVQNLVPMTCNRVRL